MVHRWQLQPQWQQQELQQQEQLQQCLLPQPLLMMVLQLRRILKILKLRFPKVVDEVVVLGRPRPVGRARAVGEVLGAAMDKSMHQALMALGKALQRVQFLGLAANSATTRQRGARYASGWL